MWARQTYFTIQPGKATELRKVYDEQIVPTIKQQKGIVDLFLLEPTEPNGQFISMSVWEKKTDAEQYDQSGTYGQLVQKLTPVFQGQPTLKSFEIKSSIH